MMEFLVEGLKKVLLVITTGILGLLPSASPVLQPADNTPPAQEVKEQVSTQSAETKTTVQNTNTVSSGSPEANGEEQVNVSGKITYLGKEIEYSFSFPKEGGTVKGGFNGLCNGSTQGNFEGGEGGLIQGSVEGACSLIVVKPRVSATYKGNIYFKDKKMSLNWTGEVLNLGNSGHLDLPLQN